MADRVLISVPSRSKMTPLMGDGECVIPFAFTIAAGRGKYMKIVPHQLKYAAALSTQDRREGRRALSFKTSQPPRRQAINDLSRFSQRLPL